MRIPEAALAELRARNPVPDVVARLGGTLRRSGSGWVGACPVCGGGKASARFEAKSDETWVCAVCEDGGDVIRLVERSQGCSFREAVAWLGGTREVDPETAARVAAEREAVLARRAKAAERYREEERKRLYALWRASAAIHDTPAIGYLRGRGIAVPGLRLRATSRMPYFHGSRAVDDGRGGTRLVARAIHAGPAMLAAILRPDGCFTGLHITWLDPGFDGRKAEIADPDTGEMLSPKKMRGSVKAGRIELVARPHAPFRLVLGEGIETVASVLAGEAPGGAPGGVVYWSGLDLGNLGGPATEPVVHPTAKHRNGHAVRVPGPVPDLEAPALPIPDSITDLVLLRDGDSDPYATDCAMQRAAARYASAFRTIRIASAPDGTDFNDVLRDAA